MYESPKKLFNGATVIEFVNIAPPLQRPHGGALCRWKRGHDQHEYVTWHVWLADDNEWHAEMGHYFQTLEEAKADYAARHNVYVGRKVHEGE